MTLSIATQHAKKLRAAKKLAQDALWRRGDLDWKLDPCKKEIHKQIQALPPHGQHVIEGCRKLGKSYLYCLIAIETALRNPGGRINYGTQTIKMAGEIVVPIINEICEDAPPDCKPVFTSSDGHWTFPNTAYVVLFGCDDEAKADRGRGPTAILSIVDEAGFIPVLRYVLNSVISPQHLRTGGRTLVGSTPPKSPGHDFCRIADAAEVAGNYAHRDIYSPGIDGIPDPDAFVAREAAQRGMSEAEYRATTDFQREYMALRVTDADTAVVPGFDAAKGEIVKTYQRPPYFDAYVSVDWGHHRDLSGGLFGYWDFKNATLVIEDEFLLRKALTDDIGRAIQEGEKRLWPEKGAYLRVLDDPGALCGDLYARFGMVIGKANRANKEAGFNTLGNLVRQRQLAIDPRCKNLIHQLRAATFNRTGNDLDRNETDGHFDLLMALVYMLKAVIRSRDPYPVGWNVGPGQVLYRPPPRTESNPYARAALSGSRWGQRVLKMKKR